MDRPLSFEPNSVLLFELRQAVRNRAVVGLLLVYVAVLSLFLAAAVLPGSTILVLVSNVTNGMVGDWYSLNKTTSVAMTILAIYYVFTSITLVAFAAGKTIGDRLHENPIFYSPYAPWRIVLGKLLFGGVISLLFLSATLPFLCVTYLMRGVDIRVVLLAAVLFFGVTQWHYFATVAFYAGAKNKFGVAFRSLPLWTIHLILSFSIGAVPAMAAEIFRDSDGFWISATLVGLFLVFMFLAFLLAWVQYAPETSNRMMPVRISLSAIQGLTAVAVVIGGIYCFFTTGDIEDAFGPYMAFMLFGIFIPAFFPIMICERETLSPRIRRTIPEDFRARLLVFPFYTGVAGAMVWVFGVVLLEGLLTGLIFIFLPGSFGHSYEYAANLHPFSYGLLCFDYCATTVILYNVLLHRWIERQWNWLPLFVLLALAPLFFVTVILIDFFTPLSAFWIFDQISEESLFFLPIPWPMGDKEFTNRQLLLGVFWAAVVVPIGAAWVRRRFREFIELP